MSQPVVDSGLADAARNETLIRQGYRMCREAGVKAPTPENAVQAVLHEAVQVLGRMPDPEERFRSGPRMTPWSTVLPNVRDEPDVTVDLTTAAAVSRAEQAATWFRHVGWGRRRRRGFSDAERRRRAVKIVWLRSRGMSFAAIGRRFGIHRSTAMRIFRRAVLDIADAINRSNPVQTAI